MPNDVSTKSAFLAMFALASCGEPIKVNAPPPPASYMTCAALPEPPDIDALKAYNTGDIQVYMKGDVDLRDSKIARWIVDVRGAWFSCHNQLAAIRDYYAAQE